MHLTLQLVKINVRTGETQLWHEKGRLVSEPVFVATPNATKEEEGVVLSTLLDIVSHGGGVRGLGLVDIAKMRSSDLHRKTEDLEQDIN